MDFGQAPPEALFIGVDPGASGSAGKVNAAGELIDCIRFSQASWRDFVEWLPKDPRGVYCMIERVAARPAFGGSHVCPACGKPHGNIVQGIASTFTFGKNAGIVEGIIIGAGLSFELVTPPTWQRALSCLSGGDKHVTKAKAEQLWPTHHRWTLEEPDGCLIAEFCRRRRLGLK